MCRRHRLARLFATPPPGDAPAALAFALRRLGDYYRCERCGRLAAYGAAGNRRWMTRWEAAVVGAEAEGWNATHPGPAADLFPPPAAGVG